MAGIGLSRRVDALEQHADVPSGGYAVLLAEQGQSIEQAKAAWSETHGPVGNRRWVVFNFGCLDAAA